MSQHHRTDLPAQYARLEQEGRAKDQRIAALERRNLEHDRRGQLAQYERTRVLDLEAELKESLDSDGKGTPETPEQFARRLQHIERYERQTPDLAALDNVAVKPGGPEPSDEMRPRGHDAALRYQREELKEGRHLDYEACLAHVSAKK